MLNPWELIVFYPGLILGFFFFFFKPRIGSKKNTDLEDEASITSLIFLQSTSPSHAVVANVQHVLHLMKQHSKVLCNDRVVNSVPLAKQVSSRSGKSKKSETPTSSSSINEELSEVLQTLQDEFGQMSL